MSNRSLKPPRTPHRSKPPRTPHRADKLPSLNADDAGQALTPASLKHVRRQRDKVSEENQRLRQDLDKLSAEHAQLQKDHQALVDQHGLCAQGAARFAALQKAHTALQATLDAEVEATTARLKEAPAAHSGLRAAEATIERLKRELKLQAEQSAAERDEMSSMARLAMQAQKDAALHVKSAMDKDKLERAERERAQREYVNSVQEEMQQALAKMNNRFDKLKNEALMALLNKKLCVHVLAPKTWLLSGSTATGYGPSQMQTDEIRAVVDRYSERKRVRAVLLLLRTVLLVLHTVLMLFNAALVVVMYTADAAPAEKSCHISSRFLPCLEMRSVTLKRTQHQQKAKRLTVRPMRSCLRRVSQSL